MREDDDREKDAIAEKLKSSTIQAIKQLNYLFEDMSKSGSCSTNDFVALFETKLKLERKLLDSLTSIQQSNENSKNYQNLLSKINDLQTKKTANADFDLEVELDK